MQEYRARKRNQAEVQHVSTQVNPTPYSTFNVNRSAHKEFKKKFVDNKFGQVCKVCDRLWFQDDLKTLTDEHHQLLHPEFPGVNLQNALACKTCVQSPNQTRIPTFSVSNGFRFPKWPENLPKLDLVSERLIAPRIPFMQIRRLRHVNGQFGIYGQIINVPLRINTMVQHLPRHIDDDRCINVHIKRRKIHKSSYLSGLVSKRNIKIWLQYLLPTPLYAFYGITVDRVFLENQADDAVEINELSEEIPIEERLTAQQETVLWNDDKYLRIAPGEQNVPRSLLFDEHAEELSFPTIYLGHFREFKEGVRVTPFMMASSELRRSDRRAVTPHHLLYMAMEIMRLRVRDSLTIAFKHIGKDTKITRQEIESDEYINQCIESNLAFLKSIPNSSWYWADRKRDLFAMIRQLGKPTIFLTVSANEIGWVPLLKTLYELKNNGVEITAEQISNLSYMQKSTLINEDAVTCSVYFNKLVNVLITLLQSKKCSPFGQYRVIHYFKRI